MYDIKPDKEELRRRERRIETLLQKYPNGIAEIEAIAHPKNPFIEGKTLLHDKLKPAATSIPIRYYKRSGGTHPVSGMPQFEEDVYEIGIWPVSARTDDKLPRDLKAVFKRPVDLLEYLMDRDKGWGSLYRLKPVSKEQQEIEKRALLDPNSLATLEDLRKRGQLEKSVSSADIKDNMRSEKRGGYSAPPPASSDELAEIRDTESNLDELDTEDEENLSEFAEQSDTERELETVMG